MANKKITLSRSDYGLKFMLESDDGDCESVKRNTLSLGLCGWLLVIRLPRFIKPKAHWVDTSKYSWGKPGGGYWEYERRAYGVYLYNNHFVVNYGPQADHWPRPGYWSCFLPWNEWRHVRFSLYDTNGAHFWSQYDPRSRTSYDDRKEAEEKCPAARFRFNDYDGEEIEATTRIEEHEWKRGTKAFKWLSLFWKPRVRRSLDIEFSKEVGREKGSWKGGTLGHGIDMLPGELHAAAFARYCLKHRLTNPVEIRATQAA